MMYSTESILELVTGNSSTKSIYGIESEVIEEIKQEDSEVGKFLEAPVVDNDGDGTCDVCGNEIPEGTETITETELVEGVEHLRSSMEHHYIALTLMDKYVWSNEGALDKVKDGVKKVISTILEMWNKMVSFICSLIKKAIAWVKDKVHGKLSEELAQKIKELKPDRDLYKEIVLKVSVPVIDVKVDEHFVEQGIKVCYTDVKSHLSDAVNDFNTVSLALDKLEGKLPKEAYADGTVHSRVDIDDDENSTYQFINDTDADGTMRIAERKWRKIYGADKTVDLDLWEREHLGCDICSALSSRTKYVDSGKMEQIVKKSNECMKKIKIISSKMSKTTPKKRHIANVKLYTDIANKTTIYVNSVFKAIIGFDKTNVRFAKQLIAKAQETKQDV